ncbi:MAG: RsbRD N-terminal domain-containing protein [candidate division Zixibacteria bacterium]|nr:RsbRD N-terminal domain-containing protein [candidate division Zixibacteria bacterium]
MLSELLANEKTSILEHWVRLIVETYPVQSKRFLVEQSNRFSNPVGHTVSTEAGVLLDCILTDNFSDQVEKSLNNIVRIRTVQEFTASEAVGFVFSLKRAIRETIAGCGWETTKPEELSELDDRIDRLVLLAFDQYMKCRDQMSEIRVNEIKRRFQYMPGSRKLSSPHQQEEHDTNDPASDKQSSGR